MKDEKIQTTKEDVKPMPTSDEIKYLINGIIDEYNEQIAEQKKKHGTKVNIGKRVFAKNYFEKLLKKEEMPTQEDFKTMTMSVYERLYKKPKSLIERNGLEEVWMCLQRFNRLFEN